MTLSNNTAWNIKYNKSKERNWCRLHHLGSVAVWLKFWAHKIFPSLSKVWAKLWAIFWLLPVLFPCPAKKWLRNYIYYALRYFYCCQYFEITMLSKFLILWQNSERIQSLGPKFSRNFPWNIDEIFVAATLPLGSDSELRNRCNLHTLGSGSERTNQPTNLWVLLYIRQQTKIRIWQRGWLLKRQVRDRQYVRRGCLSVTVVKHAIAW